MALLAGGCSASGGSSDTSAGSAGQALAEDDASVTAKDSAKTGSTVNVAATVSGSQRIRNAQVSLTVEAIEPAAAKVRAVATDLGGLVQKEQTATEPGGEDGTSEIVLRVPADRLDTALEKLDAVGTRSDLSTTTKDVTTEVADLDSRLATQEKSVERLRALLDDATSVKDVIAIESELTTRQADLESLQAQARAVKDKVALSTLTVSLILPDPADDGDEEEAAGFLVGLETGWNGLKSGGVAVLTLLGFLLPPAAAAAVVGVPAWLAYRRFRAPSPAPTSNP